MSTKTAEQKNARSLQRLAEDELGTRPKLTTCYEALRAHEPRRPDQPRELYLSEVFMWHRDRLRLSAEQKATPQPGDPPKEKR
jgi:hypothetical protein